MHFKLKKSFLICDHYDDRPIANKWNSSSSSKVAALRLCPALSKI